VLSSVLNWNLTYTILFVGILVTIYTVSGGSKAVSLTQKWQMMVILIGMGVAFATVIQMLPDNVGLVNGLKIAGASGKTDAINFSFDLDERYTFWSGITGGFFLALSYFGTDQSQVQRYLGGSSVRESRLGLMFNAVFKIPMQFFILLTGVLVFVFFQFQDHDILFNKTALNQLEQTEYKDELAQLRIAHQENHQLKEVAAYELADAFNSGDESEISKASSTFNVYRQKGVELRDSAKDLAVVALPKGSNKDSDYVFITYILNFMPVGLIGLLLAVILSAAMSSTAGELNALGSTTSIDFYKRMFRPDESEKHYVNASKWLTAIWGCVAMGFALFANLFENLIEAVNILGSIFYGTILGIFMTAFFLKFVKGKSVFIAAIIAQVTIIVLFIFFNEAISYLYYNVIGCGLVMILSAVMASIAGKSPVVNE
jgi:Na+/proline symporter